MESRSRTALEELLAHGAWARRLAHSLVGEAAAADDLVQEAWRAALERPPALDRPVRPWLGRVLTNLARQRARGAGRQAARERAAARDESLPGPDELAERLDSQRALTEELAALAEPFRTTVLLCYFEDLEPSEIARRQSLPRGHRALAAEARARPAARAAGSALRRSAAVGALARAAGAADGARGFRSA